MFRVSVSHQRHNFIATFFLFLAVISLIGKCHPAIRQDGAETIYTHAVIPHVVVQASLGAWVERIELESDICFTGPLPTMKGAAHALGRWQHTRALWEWH